MAKPKDWFSSRCKNVTNHFLQLQGKPPIFVTQTNHPHATCSTRGQNHHRLVQQLDPFVERDPQNLQVFVEISIDAHFKALVAQTKAHCLVLSIMTTSQQQKFTSGIAIIIFFFDPFLPSCPALFLVVKRTSRATKRLKLFADIHCKHGYLQVQKERCVCDIVGQLVFRPMNQKNLEKFRNTDQKSAFGFQSSVPRHRTKVLVAELAIQQ